MALNLKPLADRVVVRPLEAEEKTAGGLIIPDTAKEKPQQGEILAVGAGKTGDDGQIIKMEVKVGDKVLYGKYSGTEVRVDGDDYLIMRESDIFAIVGLLRN
jgi:chaperonin GroES